MTTSWPTIVATAEAPSTTFRDQAFVLSPTYLQGPWGTKWIYTHAVILDGIADGVAYANLAGLPTVAPADALPWITLDRQIDQGPNESSDSFRLRLRQWLDLWRVAGSPRAILRAVTSYLTPGSYTIETVNDSQLTPNVTTWDVSTGGSDPPTHYQESPHNWNWDGLTMAGRSWVIIYSGPWMQWPKFGGFSYGDGTVWGATGGNPPNDASSIRGLVGKWKNAGNFVQQVIVAFDAAWYVPTLALGDPHLPGGTWIGWGTTTFTTESTGPWGATLTETENCGQWGQVATAQIPGAEGMINMGRVYRPRTSRTSVTTTAPTYFPRASRSTTTATGPRSYVPSRPATSLFLGPVV